MPTINIDREEELGINIKPEDRIPVRVDNSLKVRVAEPPIRISVSDPTKQVYEFKLNFRRALNGDYMIFDHNDIDIMILVEKKKVVAFAKDMMSDIVYGAENRLFTHLRKHGVVAYDSIQGGNVYGSMEGLMLEIKEDKVGKSLHYVLYEISRWMNSERPYFKSSEAHEDMMDDHLLDPEDEFSTELGEVPHEEEKGGIRQNGMFSPYYYGRYTY